MARTRLIRDLSILAGSFALACVLVQSGIVHSLVESTGNKYVASMVAGMFFTSVVTTAPAVVVLSDLGGAEDMVLIALTAAVGAVAVEYVLFYFIKNRLENDIEHLLSRRRSKRLRALAERPSFRWLTPLVAGVLIAVPLPTDEIAMSWLAMSKLPTRLFVPLAYAFNVIGIYCIMLVGHAFF